MDNLFLTIDGLEIEDLEEGDYQAYETELGVTKRMVSGLLIEERRATIWVVELLYSAIDAETMKRLDKEIKARRDHVLTFLPSTGGTELATGVFHLMENPAPALRRWSGDGPVWSGYSLRFEEIRGHDTAQ